MFVFRDFSVKLKLPHYTAVQYCPYMCYKNENLQKLKSLQIVFIHVSITVNFLQHQIKTTYSIL